MDTKDLITVELNYTCGGNYKYNFEVSIDASLIPDLEEGQERTIEEFSMTPSEMYNIIGAVYDSDLDHDLVTVLKITPSASGEGPQKTKSSNNLFDVENEIRNQVTLISKIVERSRTPLSENLNYQVQRGKFYGMLKVYEVLGGKEEFIIYEHQV